MCSLFGLILRKDQMKGKASHLKQYPHAHMNNQSVVLAAVIKLAEKGAHANVSDGGQDARSLFYAKTLF